MTVNVRTVPVEYLLQLQKIGWSARRVEDEGPDGAEARCGLTDGRSHIAFLRGYKILRRASYERSPDGSCTLNIFVVVGGDSTQSRSE